MEPAEHGPRAAYDGHVAAMAAQDLDAIVAGYAPDAVLVHPAGAGRGRDYARDLFAASLDAMTDLNPQVDVVVYEDVVLAVWQSGPGVEPARRGADTFVVRDGLITHHTGTGI